MVKIVILENGCGQAEIMRVIGMVPTTLSSSVIVISSEAAPKQASGAAILPLQNNDYGAALLRVLREAGNSRLILIDARAPLNDATVAQFISRVQDQRGSALTYMALMVDHETVTLPELTPDTLVGHVTDATTWPLFCVAFDPSTLPSDCALDGSSSLEVIVKILLQLTMEGETTHQACGFLELKDNARIDELCVLPKAARAHCLETLINAANIEELFPSHAWETHHKESAAACYHTLAALAIRLEAYDMAIECLALGDQFEDSPRSLALKGIIALNKGETLTAVANMVSSLQLYENRKRTSAEHYLTFKPRNLEVINTNLNAGLSALNKRDNERALSHFADAVFNFDSFYEETGLEPIKTLSH